MMMWSVTQSQTCWSVKSSRPEEALLSTKLVDEMESSRAIHNLKDDALKCCTQYVSKSARPSRGTGLKEVNSLIPVPKKGSTKECSNHQTVVFISHADVQPGFRKGRGTRGQCANIHWIIEKAREFQINIYFCFIDNAKAFDCVDHKKLWKILKEMGIPDHFTCLPQNLYAGQKATARTGHGTTH